MENPIKMDDLGGPSLFLEGRPHIIISNFKIPSRGTPMVPTSIRQDTARNMPKSWTARWVYTHLITRGSGFAMVCNCLG